MSWQQRGVVTQQGGFSQTTQESAGMDARRGAMCVSFRVWLVYSRAWGTIYAALCNTVRCASSEGGGLHAPCALVHPEW